MALYASFAGSRVVSARVTIPLYGAWVADVKLADDAEVPSSGTLTIADLSLVGAVWRGSANARKGGAPFASSRALRLVGGAGGWGTVVPRQFYADPKGVKLGVVLRDVAAAVGESINVPAAMAAQVLGDFWARGALEASRVIGLASGEAWWVDNAGVTQIGARPAASFVWDGPITYRPEVGVFVVAPEELAPWVPGASFTSPLVTGEQLISSVTVILEAGGKLRVEVMVGSPDRLLASFDALVRTNAPRTAAPSPEHLALWSYSVTSATETTFTGRALSSRCPEPDLPKIPIMPGVGGAKVKPLVGAIVGVMFLDGDPAKPRVVSWDLTVPERETIDASSELALGPSAAAVKIAGGGPAVARVDDVVSCGSLTATGATFTLTDGTGAVTSFLIASSSGTITITPTGAGAIGGKITTGSTKATSG